MIYVLKFRRKGTVKIEYMQIFDLGKNLGFCNFCHILSFLTFYTSPPLGNEQRWGGLVLKCPSISYNFFNVRTA